MIYLEKQKGVLYPTASDLIGALRKACKLAGAADLPVIGGYMTDETSISRITIVNEKDCDWQSDGGKPTGIFLG